MTQKKAGPANQKQGTGTTETNLNSSIPQETPKKQCPSWAIITRRGDSGLETEYIPIPCSDPLCVPCQRLRAGRARQRWLPALEKMRSPKFLTLTIKSGPDLAERWATEAKSFRRFLDLRLGRRNWKKFQEQAERYLTAHYAGRDGKVDRVKKGLTEIGRFGRRLDAITRSRGRTPKMRDLIGPGLSAREVTWRRAGWHVHRHIAVDCDFLPWSVLVVVWLAANKGEGRIVDIRAMTKTKKGLAEIIKYVAKPGSIPDSKADEFRRVVKNKKRLWPLGGLQPVPEEPDTRPILDIGFGCTLYMGEVKGGYIALVRLWVTGANLLLVRGRGEKWRPAEPGLDLIPMAFACHSPTGEPPPAQQLAFDTG